ncbi:hypothetical protein RUND412_010201, partial [Rhizina undulata]
MPEQNSTELIGTQQFHPYAEVIQNRFLNLTIRSTLTANETRKYSLPKSLFGMDPNCFLVESLEKTYACYGIQQENLALTSHRSQGHLQWFQFISYFDANAARKAVLSP